MAYHTSPSPAPSAHPHVSYTSYPHSKDVNNSIGATSEAGDHSEANLGVRVAAFETEMKDFKTGMTGLKTEVKDRGTEMKRNDVPRNTSQGTRDRHEGFQNKI